MVKAQDWESVLGSDTDVRSTEVNDLTLYSHWHCSAQRSAPSPAIHTREDVGQVT